MKRDEAPWQAEGPEGRALLELLKASKPGGVVTEEASARAFVAAFRRQAERRTLASAWRGLGGYRYGVAFAMALAVALLGFQLGSSWRSERSLSYQVRSGASIGRAIDAQSEPVQLDFSDGTVVTVARGSRARVAELAERGARFKLESGRMAFDVVPHPKRGLWSVEAGPFQVRVTGTVFTVDWDESEGALRVDVTRGHVVVEGAGQRRELGPGDSFQHRRPTAEGARVAEAVGEAVASAPSAEPPSVAAPAAERTPTWSQLVAAGRFDAVLQAAARRGVDACLDACVRDDLRALADAARLSGNAALAERALLAQRARFSGSAEATAAAFLLGRAAEERQDARALVWYDRYLAEAPQGRFASDALGRKMMFVARRDPKAGAALAAQYLARFPEGSYSSHARSVQGRAR